MQELTSSGPVVYEVDLDVEPAIIDQYDAWLRDHVAEMLRIRGFVSAEILVPETGKPERARRVVQYRLRDRAALDEYLDTHAAEMRAAGEKRFGDRVKAARRILDAAESPRMSALPPTGGCPNCGSLLVMEYCAHCGQSSRDYHTSIFNLAHEILGDTLNFDSRVFRSVIPLLFRPGKLTRDFMEGRRARYIPPLRLYLFISLVFFALVGFSARDITPDIDAARISADTATTAPETPSGAVAIRPAAPGAGAQGQKATDQPGLKFDIPVSKTAEKGSLEERIATKIKAKAKQWKKDPGAFVQRSISNISIGMFILLPLYALLLKVLYLFSRRYYVEHMVFAFHVHAFTFVMFSFMLIWSRWLQSMVPFNTHGLVMTVAAVYVVLYPWFALRRTYGQGRFLTTIKYLTLGFLYFVIGVAAAIPAIVLVTAFSS